MKNTGYRYRDLARILLTNGFTAVSQRGGHVKWARGSESMVISNPTTNRMIWKRLCKEHKINETGK